MSLNLFQLAYNTTPEEFVKIVLSSGDYFPGFYRFTMGDRNYEPGHLSPHGLLSAFMDEQVCGTKYTRERWTGATTQRHNQSMDPRNRSRSDYAVYELLSTKYIEWLTTPNVYDIAVIEIDNVENNIDKDRTYFFMGSMLRFTDDNIEIGFDKLRNTSLMTIPFSFENAVDYIQTIYLDNIQDFFLPADVVASLTFDNDIGTLYMSDDTYNHVMLAHNNSVIIASNRDVSQNIPIRWAKDIILTEVVDG